MTKKKKKALSSQPREQKRNKKGSIRLLTAGREKKGQGTRGSRQRAGVWLERRRSVTASCQRSLRGEAQYGVRRKGAGNRGKKC